MDANGRVVAVSDGHTQIVVKSSSSTRSEMDDLTQSLTGPKRPFAMHKPAIVGIARAMSLPESILLSGEGKDECCDSLASASRQRASLPLPFLKDH